MSEFKLFCIGWAVSALLFQILSPLFDFIEHDPMKQILACTGIATMAVATIKVRGKA